MTVSIRTGRLRKWSKRDDHMPNNEEKSGSNSKIIKVAGLSLLGFCAVSLAADRFIASEMGTQVAGFCGAFLGALAAQRRGRSRPAAPNPEPSKEPVEKQE